MKKVETEFKPSVPIKGSCHEDFQEVAEIFARNFDKYQEIGSSICVVIDGETAVDIWTGHKNEQKTEDCCCFLLWIAVGLGCALSSFVGRILLFAGYP